MSPHKRTNGRDKELKQIREDRRDAELQRRQNTGQKRTQLGKDKELKEIREDRRDAELQRIQNTGQKRTHLIKDKELNRTLQRGQKR